MKYIESADVLCPFYHKNSTKTIICESPYCNDGVQMARATEESIEKVMKKYCENDYHFCPTAKACFDKWEQRNRANT